MWWYLFHVFVKMHLSPVFSLRWKRNNGTLKTETKQVPLLWQILWIIVTHHTPLQTNGSKVNHVSRTH